MVQLKRVVWFGHHDLKVESSWKRERERGEGEGKEGGRGREEKRERREGEVGWEYLTEHTWQLGLPAAGAN